MDFDEVTKAAQPSGELAILSGHGARTIEHMIPVPTGLCPRSGNPVGGTISIRYDSDHALEVVTLTRFLKTAARAEGVRSLEGWGEHIGKACAQALRSVVWVTVDAEINPGPQRLIARFTAIPGR